MKSGRFGSAQLVRGHRHIENHLHWVLDDTFQEDRSRLRRGWAARNMAALRRRALNLLTILQMKYWPKVSIRRLRKMMAHNRCLTMKNRKRKQPVEHVA